MTYHCGKCQAWNPTMFHVHVMGSSHGDFSDFSDCSMAFWKAMFGRVNLLSDFSRFLCFH